MSEKRDTPGGHEESATGDEPRLPPRPVRPASDECCKAGCDPCVFELYEDELARWEQTVARIRARREATDARGCTRRSGR